MCVLYIIFTIRFGQRATLRKKMW